MNTMTGVWRIRHTCISLQGLRLHAFRRVNDDDHAVAGRQHAERVLGEVLVARGVKNVDLHVLVLETHDGGGHGDPSGASISMKSEVAVFLILFDFTAPATCMAPPKSNNFSVKVVYPRRGD